MTIYLVIQGDYRDDATPLAAFSTEEAAKEYAAIRSQEMYVGGCYVCEIPFDEPETRELQKVYTTSVDRLTGEMTDGEPRVSLEPEYRGAHLGKIGPEYWQTVTVYQPTQEQARLEALEALRLWEIERAGRKVALDDWSGTLTLEA